LSFSFTYAAIALGRIPSFRLDRASIALVTLGIITALPEYRWRWPRSSVARYCW
jgi:hypothetical protein